MAPNVADAQHAMILDMLASKSRGDDNLKDDDIAANAGCSTRAVHYCRSNMRLYGSTKAPSNGAGRPKSLTPPMLAALFSQLDIEPGMRQREMVAFLREVFDVTVSRYSISRALRNAEWSKKVMQNVAKERNDDLRDDHMYELSQFHSYQLVFIDESGLDKSIGTRKRGWAGRGKRPRQVKQFHRGRRLQILPAYTQDGVLHFRVFEGSTDAEIFKDFIKELLPYCGRWPEPKSVLVMDNVSFHR